MTGLVFKKRVTAHKTTSIYLVQSNIVIIHHLRPCGISFVLFCFFIQHWNCCHLDLTDQHGSRSAGLRDTDKKIQALIKGLWTVKDQTVYKPFDKLDHSFTFRFGIIFFSLNNDLMLKKIKIKNSMCMQMYLLKESRMTHVLFSVDFVFFIE